ncbi:head decoration protein [Caldibacillus lycopersici]|uniref:Head decoration protein n=1 Tax=Perspicuibacillus lycopersici TaxID=1325689 RepID=A0AAE3IVF2_9BACI|nr:head decoration protein [Perspicuibacillus lycopersici]MCU9614089.1 head decoration protein [Perspicuibacillus lycopersici]
MRLQPVQLFEMQDHYEILASYEVIREVTNGITIDASTVAAVDGKKIVKKGMPMGKLSNGKYAPYNPDGTDGSQNPTVILKHTYDVTDGDVVAAGYEVAKVISERIPVEVDDTLKGKMPQIIFA